MPGRSKSQMKKLLESHVSPKLLAKVLGRPRLRMQLYYAPASPKGSEAWIMFSMEAAPPNSGLLFGLVIRSI